jgi:hypothetical protein
VLTLMGLFVLQIIRPPTAHLLDQRFLMKLIRHRPLSLVIVLEKTVFKVKNSLHAIYDKITSKISIIDQGFLKASLKGKESYAYVIKNEQPLKCSTSSL